MVTHCLVDVLDGASKLLLHPFLKEVDAELQVEVLLLQLGDLLQSKHKTVTTAAGPNARRADPGDNDTSPPGQMVPTSHSRTL